MEMDESLVGSPGFKPVCEALTLSWVGSIPTRLRQMAPILLLYFGLVLALWLGQRCGHIALI